MTTSTFANKTTKKIGRPRMGDDPAETVAVRLTGDVLAKVDRWAVEHRLTRSDAMRDLIVRGLGSPSTDAPEPPRQIKRKVEPWVKNAADRAEARSKVSRKQQS